MVTIPTRRLEWKPTLNFDAEKIPKLEVEWTNREERVFNTKSKALYVIFYGINMHEFKRISKCTMTKEALEILQTALEGTNIVKQSKI
ncbi:gag-pol polyprotein [Gossypium australe]|uniref:Gag-pol polyprotein n=1 Tax=Gossypium australe TaxID=47621 RepID=A0A5B6WHI6_9ROSI|nr:gag-pol polyprotein [Gossypium australe]